MTMPKINLTDATATIIAAVIGAVAALLVAFISNSFTTEKFEQKISELETENAALKAQIVDLQKEPIADSETQITILTKRISELEAEIASDKERIADLEQENADLQAQNTSLKAQLEGTTGNSGEDSPEELPQTPEKTTYEEATLVKDLLPYNVNPDTNIYSGTDDTKYFTVSGNRVTNGVHLRVYHSYGAYALWNTDRQYDKMAFMICSTDEKDASMEVYLNNKLTETYNLQWDAPKRLIEIALNGASNVKLKVTSGQWGLYNITFSDSTGQPTEEESYKETVNWMKKLPPYQVSSKSVLYDDTDSSKYFVVGGKRKTNGILFSYTFDSPAYAIWDTDGQYNKMAFTVWGINGTSDASMEIYVNNEYQDTYDLKWDDPCKLIEIPLNGALNVKVHIQGYTSGLETRSYGVYNILFSK